MEINDDKGLLVEKGIFSKEEFWEVTKTIESEMELNRVEVENG